MLQSANERSLFLLFRMALDNRLDCVIMDYEGGCHMLAIDKYETCTLPNGNPIRYKVVNGTYYHEQTPDKVIETLEYARQTGARIRVFYGDVESGRDWMEIYGTNGYVGRSTGQVKVPLLITSSRSIGGDPILDHCIVRITVNKVDAYRHVKYHLPHLEIKENQPYEYIVVADGNTKIARVKTRSGAERWIEFLKGERNSK
jgi:hypothetical protein